MPGSDFREPRNGEGVHVRLRIRFLFSTEYNHLFDAHDLCGTRNIWSCLFLLGPSSSKKVILKTSHATPHIGLETSKLSGG